MNDVEFEQLAAQYSKMIYSIIRSLHVYKNYDEFYQIGLFALWNASQSFNEQKGVQFSTYAYHFIKGRMQTFMKREARWEDHCYYPSEEYWSLLECETNFLEKETLLSYFRPLSERQKKWVLLHFYEGLSNRDIAELEQINVCAVRGWEREAMAKVKQSVKQAGLYQ